MKCVRSLVMRRLLDRRRVPHEHQDRDTEHHSDRDATTRRLSVSAVVIWDTHRLVAQNRIHHFRSDQMAGTCSLMVHDNALMVPHRETTYRPGPHPHRSARYSFGPHLIFILRINIFFWIVQLAHRDAYTLWCENILRNRKYFAMLHVMIPYIFTVTPGE